MAVTGVRPARAGGHAVRTARSWRGIVAFTHPRTGGAHDGSASLSPARLRERRSFGARGGSWSNELFLDLLVNYLKPTFGASRALSEELDLGL
jgi:hypothetical protein